MKKILVVDDEEDNLSTVKSILERAGYSVYTAISGDDALKKLAPDTDLILLDIMMPGTPVKEVVKKIKGIKILFFSVVRTTEAQKEQLLTQKNIIGYIQKPFEIKDMLAQVKKALGK